MRTVKETTKTEKKEVVKQEFNLKEAFVLWKKTARSGLEYLSGYTLDENGNKTYLNGFFNSKKENPKEPDIRILTAPKEGEKAIEVAALWVNVSETKGTIYLTGSTNDKEKLVGWYSKVEDDKKPYIRVCYKENNDSELPF